ncbi:hypothetical protein KUTeg_001460 [Tegillarca granosa]|uniref:NADH dehydrogenase [ubiquinone] 1 beta subcomplex subunit 3 n=1 Tax=Tegillarca granosa TaxID=220873 RepID=A0ABQ9FVZ5_TEGGR|nr:hypothetical protein KUTeg_001460 [Tegillarca granosa]
MGGGDFKWVCPDWRQYKVENVPELTEVQRRLAKEGLKSPWLRNDVWRYNYRPNKSPSDDMRMGRKAIFRSFKPALAAAIITAGLKYLFSKDDSHH